MSKITITVPEITIGIDLGNKKHDICVLNSVGEIIDQVKIENNIICLEEYFERYKIYSKVRIAMEVGSSSLWVSTKLKDMVLLNLLVV